MLKVWALLVFSAHSSALPTTLVFQTEQQCVSEQRRVEAVLHRQKSDVQALCVMSELPRSVLLAPPPSFDERATVRRTSARPAQRRTRR